MNCPDWLPLFPLGQPLFPGIGLDLQIFEQRYLKLVKRCLRENESFGICPIREGREVGAGTHIFPLGTEVSIVDWTQLKNGLLGISVVGGRRFSLGEQVVDPDGLHSAQIRYLPEEVREPVPAEMAGLCEIYRELLQHPEIARRLPGVEALNASDLSFGLAQVLPMSIDDRLSCLKQLNGLERLAFLAEHIEQLAANA